MLSSKNFHNFTIVNHVNFVSGCFYYLIINKTNNYAVLYAVILIMAIVQYSLCEKHLNISIYDINCYL